MRRTRILVALALLVVTAGMPAVAQETPEPAQLGISTPYPQVAVEAGGQASFDLSITAPESTPVTLGTSDLPEGWTATFRGGGFELDGVMAGPTPPDVTLDLGVPVDAAEGNYGFSVVADADGTALTLALQVRVSAQAGGEVSLTPDFPGLRVAAGDRASFTVELRNDTPSDLQFELDAAGPAGWDVTAQPASEPQAATIQVDSGSRTNINVNATSLPRTGAGQYTISVQATSPEVQVQAEMIVEIVGSFSLQLATADQRLSTEVRADGSTDVELVVTNTGTAPIRGVDLSARPPSGWEVTFAEPVIADIGAGESVVVVATVTPSDQAIAGDYMITLSARSDQANAEVDIRTTVNPSPLWGFVGVGLIALTFAALAWVFRRFGRR